MSLIDKNDDDSSSGGRCNDSAFFIAGAKPRVDGNNFTDQKYNCSNYKKYDDTKSFDCSLPKSKYYFSHDAKVAKSDYSKYTIKNIVKDLDKINKKNDVDDRRCACDYIVTNTWARVKGEDLWKRYKKHGFWDNDNGVYKYLKDAGLQDDQPQLWSIMRLLCQVTNTTNPRGTGKPNIWENPATFFKGDLMMCITYGIVFIFNFIVMTLSSKNVYNTLKPFNSGYINQLIFFVTIFFSIFLYMCLSALQTQTTYILYILPIIAGFIILLGIYSRNYGSKSVKFGSSIVTILIALFIGFQFFMMFPENPFGGYSSAFFQFCLLLIMRYSPSVFGKSHKNRWNIPFITIFYGLIDLSYGMTPSIAKFKEIGTSNSSVFNILS